MGFRKHLSADGLHKIVKHTLLREQFKVMNSEYTWQDCIMSGLAVFGFKFPSLLQFEKDKAAEHPHLKILIVEDGLASNFPHLSLLDSLNMQYIIGVKPGYHKYLFNWIKDSKPMIHQFTDDLGTQHEFHAYTHVPLNDANYDYRVNVLEYWETKKDGRKQHFSWVTKLPLTAENVYEVMRAGRARWKIESVKPSIHSKIKDIILSTTTAMAIKTYAPS